MRCALGLSRLFSSHSVSCFVMCLEGAIQVLWQRRSGVRGLVQGVPSDEAHEAAERAEAAEHAARYDTQDAYYRVHLSAESRSMMHVKEEAAGAEVAYCDAADAEGSEGGSGSGAGCGCPAELDGACWCGRATLASMDYGVLRLIASFLPLKGWVTIMPTVFAGALYAVYEGRPLPTRRKELVNTIVGAYKETVSNFETEVRSLQAASLH